jgi:hypothetical protein
MEWQESKLLEMQLAAIIPRINEEQQEKKRAQGIAPPI